MSSLGSLLASSPEHYPHRLDAVNEAVHFIRLTADQYRAASFLDDRVLSPATTGTWIRLEEIEAASTHLPEQLGFIFHQGHVGSTLLSRMLDAAGAFHGVREPSALTLLSHMAQQLDRPESLWSAETFERRLGLFLRLWSRPAAAGQMAVVKATSWASELAEAIVSRPSRPRAVLLKVPAESYLAGVLASPGGLSDVRGSAAQAMARLHGRLGETPWTLHAMSLGERVAMVWVCEMLALEAAWRAAPDRTLWLNFEALLRDPASCLGEVAAHLGRPLDANAIAGVINGPTMSRYSKQPEHPFDPGLRRKVLAQSRLVNAAELAAGQRWLDAAVARYPHIGALIECAAHHQAA